MLESIYYYFPPFLSLAEFLKLGGPVLILIGITGFLMWCLVIERFIFLHTGSKQNRHLVLSRWNALNDNSCWSTEQIKACWVSQYTQLLEKNMPLIKTCVTTAPLLGLLGTVTGMIEVFDVMSTSGLSNTRAMSDGIAKATVPTMAGMVISLSGFMVITFIQQKITEEQQQLTEHLTHS